MNFFSKLFSKKSEKQEISKASTKGSQMVIIQFFYGLEDLTEFHLLEQKIKDLLKRYEIGHYHGHDISMDFGEGSMYFSSHSANDLFLCICPVLESHIFMDKAVATLRLGEFDNENALETDKLIHYNKMKFL
jgi:cupin superfamily acireductone dioxygenase involved in methionine salvage